MRNTRIGVEELSNISSYQTLWGDKIGKVIKQSRSSIYKLVHICTTRGIPVNRGFRPFYTACHFNELSRGSALCLLNASFEKLFHNTMFYAKIDNHGVCWGNMGCILARLRLPVAVAFRVAQDLPYWAMRSAPYRLIRMAIKMASKVGAFFSVIDFCHA